MDYISARDRAQADALLAKALDEVERSQRERDARRVITQRLQEPMRRVTAAQRAKTARAEVFTIVVEALASHYDSLKISGERKSVQTPDSKTIRIRFAEFPDEAPVYVRIEFVAEN